jgi:predicted membrane chloride channel (bestrophin family)
MSPAAAEIAKIEHELDILRSRYAIFQRWAKIMKWFFIGLAVTISLAFVGYGTLHDALVAVIVSVIIVVIVAGLYLTRNDTAYHRWIDVVSPAPGWPWGRIFNIGPKSEAAAIETMIAEREARLADIKKQSA